MNGNKDEIKKIVENLNSAKLSNETGIINKTQIFFFS